MEKREIKKRLKQILIKALAVIGITVALVATVAVPVSAATVSEKTTVFDYSQLYLIIGGNQIYLPTCYVGESSSDYSVYYQPASYSYSIRWRQYGDYIYYQIRLSDTSTLSAELHAKYEYSGSSSSQSDLFYDENLGGYGNISGTDRYYGFGYSNLKNVQSNPQGVTFSNTNDSGQLVGALQYGANRGSQYSLCYSTNGTTNTRLGYYSFYSEVDRYFTLSPNSNSYVLRLGVENPSTHTQRLGGVQNYLRGAVGSYSFDTTGMYHGFGDFLSDALGGFLSFGITPYITLAGILAAIIAITGLFVLLRLWGAHG